MIFYQFQFFLDKIGRTPQVAGRGIQAPYNYVGSLLNQAWLGDHVLALAFFHSLQVKHWYTLYSIMWKVMLVGREKYSLKLNWN